MEGVNVTHWLVGRRLLALRLKAKKTREDVDEAELASPTKLWRIETGRQAVKKADIWALCALYRATGDEINEIVRLSETRGQPGRWEGDVVPGWLGLYVELENASRQIETWHAELVHGALQIEDYARAVVGVDHRLDPDTVEERIRLRMERQEILLDAGAAITSIVGEGALKVRVGSPAVMRRQTAHLREMADRPGVDVRVLPWRAGAHPTMRGPFVILSLADEADPDVVYVESHVGAQYFDQAEHLAEYRRIFAWLHQNSIDLRRYKS